MIEHKCPLKSKIYINDQSITNDENDDTNYKERTSSSEPPPRQSKVGSSATHGSTAKSGNDTGEGGGVPFHYGDVVGQRFVELRRLPVPGLLLAFGTWEQEERSEGGSSLRERKRS